MVRESLIKNQFRIQHLDCRKKHVQGNWAQPPKGKAHNLRSSNQDEPSVLGKTVEEWDKKEGVNDGVSLGL